MTTRIVLSVLIAALMTEVSAVAQAPISEPVAKQYVDSVNGLSLEQAIARALEQEPSLRAARSEIDVARGMRLQASLRPNPTVSFERREEPAGTDNQTMVAVEWPLDLFRRSGRVAAADREVGVTELAVADQERLLAAEVRMRYGDVVGAVRDLAVLDELFAATRRQHELLRSRVEEGATPPAAGGGRASHARRIPGARRVPPPSPAVRRAPRRSRPGLRQRSMAGEVRRATDPTCGGRQPPGRHKCRGHALVRASIRADGRDYRLNASATCRAMLTMSAELSGWPFIFASRVSPSTYSIAM